MTSEKRVALQAALSEFVPIYIEKVRNIPRPFIDALTCHIGPLDESMSDFEKDMLDVLASFERCENRIRTAPMEDTHELFQAMALGLAGLAFRQGGVSLLGLHWEVLR